jgi:hypothetical protein
MTIYSSAVTTMKYNVFKNFKEKLFLRHKKIIYALSSPLLLFCSISTFGFFPKTESAVVPVSTETMLWQESLIS